MKIEVKIPAMGESITTATIGEILIPSGTLVKADAELIELETDKVNQVLYATEAGIINWSINHGDVVKIGQVIGLIDTDQKESKSIVDSPTLTPPKVDFQKPKATVEQIQETKKEEKTTAEALTGARATKDQFIAEIQKPIIQESASKSIVSSSVTIDERPKASVGERKETRKKMSKIRQVIARRLVEVMQQTAMLTTFNEVDMTQVMALKEEHKEAFLKKYQSRLGYMSFFVKASVSAMQHFPEINTYIDGDDIVYREYFDIGIAVGTEKGLIVPVVRGCDKLSFAQIESSIEEFAKKAREGGLTPQDLQGGGFTITNGGVYGSLLSTPILNSPQSAILGMHKIQKRAVVIDDQIVIRPMMNLALSYDHRVVDGKEAVSFLVHIKNCLENPLRLLLNI